MNEEKKRINWKPYIITAIISLIIGFFFFALFRWILKRSISDGFAYPAVILVAFAGLMWIAREGFFDLFAYGFKQMGSMIFSKNASEHNDYAGYREKKNQVREKRPKTFLAVGAVGLLYLLATIIVFIISKL